MLARNVHIAASNLIFPVVILNSSTKAGKGPKEAIFLTWHNGKKFKQRKLHTHNGCGLKFIFSYGPNYKPVVDSFEKLALGEIRQKHYPLLA